MVIDGVQFNASGLVGSYLLERGFKYDILEGNISIKVFLSNIAQKV